MQDVNVSVRVSEAELAGAGSLGIEVLVQEFDGVLARIERRQERVRIGGVRHVQMHDARPVRRRGPYVGSMLLERHAALSAGRHDKQRIACRDDPGVGAFTGAPTLVCQCEPYAVLGSQDVFHGLLVRGGLTAERTQPFNIVGHIS